MSYSEALRHVLSKHGVNSFAALGRRIGIDRTTVSHHVSALERTGDLDCDFIARIAEEFGTTQELLKARIQAQRDGAMNLKEMVKSLQLAGIPPAAHFQHRLSTIFETLPAGSSYFFATHELPWEFEHEAFQAVIAKALKNGVHICYFFPGEDETANSDGFTAYFSQLVGRADPGWKYLAEGYLAFREILRDDHNCSSDDLANLCAFSTSDGFLTNPLQRLAYFSDGPDKPQARDGYAIIECVFSADSPHAATKIWQPLNSKQTSIVRRAFYRVHGDNEQDPKGKPIHDK